MRIARGLAGVVAFVLVSVGAALVSLVLMTMFCGC